MQSSLRGFFCRFGKQSADFMLLRRISLLSPFTLASLLIVSILSHDLSAQVNQPEETPGEADSIQIQPFQTSRLTEAFNRSFSLINESGNGGNAIS